MHAAFCPIPLNQGWEGDWIVYNTTGKTNCVVTAQNAVGDTVTVYPELRVYEVDFDGNKVMNCTAVTCTVPAVPGLPAATGLSGTGNVMGYVGTDGQLYRDAEGTIPCNGTCISDGTTTNDGSDSTSDLAAAIASWFSGGGDDTTNGVRSDRGE